jgi:predicted ester cyclase
VGPNSRLYLSLIDEVFHRKNMAAVAAHITPGYRAHDPFYDEDEVGSRRGLSELALRELREVRYEVCDLFEAADRCAARFILLGRKQGKRVAVPGISINRFEDGRIREGWIVADYGDVADFAPPAAVPADAWDGAPLPVVADHPSRATSRLSAYRWLVQQTYERRTPEAIIDALHPEYVSFDPFRDRGVGPHGVIAFQQKLIAMYTNLAYHIVDAVESDDRLAVRYRAEGIDATGRRVVVPGISINHFDGARIRRNWTLNHYGALT